MARKTATQRVQTPSGPVTLTIPHLFAPRSYQRRPMAFMDTGGKRAVTVWHRRAGKDLTWLNQTIKRMVLEPFGGTYLYIFPKLTQGRRDLWDAKSSADSGGRPFRAHFPPELVMESSETEMQITLRPLPHQRPQPIADGRGGTKMVGSIFQVMGTDKESINNLRGVNCAGAVFSEYQDQNPEGYTQIIQPVLLENGGWAAFDFTPRGENHAYDLYRMAHLSPDWFCELLTVDDTRRDAPGESGGPVISLADIEQLRREGTPEEIIQQEYYCSFKGYLRGTIYGDLLTLAQKDGRIGRVTHDPNRPVGVMCDIARSDVTALWFYQMFGREVGFIDYYANSRQGADHYVHVCKMQKPYVIARVVLPWDAKIQGYTATESTERYFRRMLCPRVDLAEKLPVQNGVDMVRRMFHRFVFDEVKCGARPTADPHVPSGLESLSNYRREWNDDKSDYSGPPIHDKFSHGADALRTGIVGWQEGLEAVDFDAQRVRERAKTDFAALGPHQGRQRRAGSPV